jgi:hypothetical protein
VNATTKERLMMETTNYLSTEEVSRIFTVYSPNTFRLLAMAGEVPAAKWCKDEPVFRRDPSTVRAILRLTRAEKRSKRDSGRGRKAQ